MICIQALCKFVSLFEKKKNMQKISTWVPIIRTSSKFQKPNSDGPFKVAHCQNKRGEKKKTRLRDATKLIRLINMNHNKHPSSCKSRGQKC
jgi:hypothetical protein